MQIRKKKRETDYNQPRPRGAIITYRKLPVRIPGSEAPIQPVPFLTGSGTEDRLSGFPPVWGSKKLSLLDLDLNISFFHWFIVSMDFKNQSGPLKY